MDRHVLWLRRRIVASVASQTGWTFGAAFAFGSGLLLWRTDGSVPSAIAIAFVGAQLVAIGRVGHAIRNNPLSNAFLKRYIETLHRYTIDESGGECHRQATELLGFYPVVSVHDPDVEPSPVFDLFQTADRVVTAAVSRASGAVSLFSQLSDGRILFTDSRVVAPHERLVVNVAPGQHPALLIAAHRKALQALPCDPVPEPLARKMMAIASHFEHEAYSQLGPLLGPFLDLEPQRRSPGRLTVRLDGDDLRALAGLDTRPQDRLARRAEAREAAGVAARPEAGTATMRPVGEPRMAPA